MLKKLKQPAGYMTSFSERLSYWIYFAGQAFSYALLVLVLPTYLLMVGVDVKKIAAVMLAVKIWDAVNDTIFGIIFDKIKFKSGKKCIPWLKITVVFIPLASLFMYLIPSNLGETFKLIWFVVAYILWDTAYTLSDVPIYSLVSSMTSNLEERNSLLTIARIFASGGAGVFLICSILVSAEVGMSFPAVALIICVLMAIMLIPICIKGKERVKSSIEQEESYTFRSMLRYLKTNKYLLQFFSGYMLSGILGTAATVELFVSYYLFGSALFSTLMYAVSGIPMVLCALFINRLLKRFDKFKLYRTCVLISVIIGLAIYFAGYKNIIVYMALVVIRAVPLAITGILGLTFTPDCVEYGKYKTGIDARGIAFAVQSFAAKINSVSQSIALLILGLFGWAAVEASSFAELEAMHIEQSAAALNGLWITYALVPVIGSALSLIPYFMYKLNDRDIQIMAKFNAGEITRGEAEAQLSRKY